MIAILSPAKTLDFETKVSFESSKPRLLKHSKSLIKVLREKDESAIVELMDISDKLAVLNKERYHAFKPTHTINNAKQSVFAFRGDVYQGLEAETFDAADTEFAQEHMRMLSGLYGLLRPLDLIQPYRLEMGTKLKHNGYNSLYEFWGDNIVKVLNKDLKTQGDNILLNLASNEYFKSIDRKTLKARIINCDFLDFKNGTYKIISFYAKRARGSMAKFVIKNRIHNVEELKAFNGEGYMFDDQSSEPTKLVFKRG